MPGGTDATIYLLATAKIDGITGHTIVCTRDNDGDWSFAQVGMPDGVHASCVSINSHGVIALISSVSNTSGTNNVVRADDPTPTPTVSAKLATRIALLNGAQTGFDGKDLFGKRPATRNSFYLSNDNSSTAESIRILGSNKLGILPLDNAYATSFSAFGSSVYSFLVQAMVPAAPAGVQYKWHVSYRNCSAIIAKVNGNWVVTSVNSPNNPTQENNDTTTAQVYTTTPSPKGCIYYTDAPGAGFGFYIGIKADDYIYEQSDYTYTISTNENTPQIICTFHIGHEIIARKKPTTQDPTKDWDIQKNAVTTQHIPTCQVQPAQVTAIVNDNLPIVIDPNVNKNLYVHTN